MGAHEPARKFMQVLFNGRNTLIEFDEPISLRHLLGDEAGGGGARAACHARVARVVCEAARGAHRAGSVAPTHDRQRVLRTRAVRAVVAQEMREKKITRRQAMLKARQYAEEIAANYSHAFIRFMEAALTRLWNRLYDGVEFGHVETLEQTAEGNEDRLCPLPSQPHGLPAAVVRDLRARLCDPAHRRRHQPQSADRRTVPAQGRRILHSPQLPRQCAVHRRLHEVPRRHHGARALDRVLHRRRPQPHGPAVAAEDRHAVR